MVAKMYVPSSSYLSGSSVSHHDEDTYTIGGDALMTPILNPGETIHSVGDIVLTAFSDMGYDLRSTVTFGQTQMYRASDIDVGTMEDAQIGNLYCR